MLFLILELSVHSLFFTDLLLIPDIISLVLNEQVKLYQELIANFKIISF